MDRDLSSLQKHFPESVSDGRITRRILLPVVHCTTKEQSLRNTLRAKDNGADGVFLINHGIKHSELFTIFEYVSNNVPNFWLGLNALDLYPQDLFMKIPDSIFEKVRGIWVDDAHIDERLLSNEQGYPSRVVKAARTRNFSGLYFGGVAFKYKREVKDLEIAAKLSSGWMDVVCTSGPGTGKAADIEKIQRIRSGLGNFPLAIASGITAQNVAEFLPYIDIYLVASGISSSFEELDEQKVKELAHLIHSWFNKSE